MKCEQCGNEFVKNCEHQKYCCYKCSKRARRVRYRTAKPNKLREERVRWRLKHNKETRAYQSKYYFTRKNVEYSHWRIGYLIKKGVIKKSTTCSSCGRICKLHAHHVNYDNPYDIIWLCPSCHGKLHYQLRMQKLKIVSN